MPNVVVGGPFGTADPGEEAQLAAFCAAFPHWRVTALSANPDATSSRHRCESVSPADPTAMGRLMSNAEALVYLGDQVFNPRRSTTNTSWARQAKELTVRLSKTSAIGPLVFLGAGLSDVPDGTTQKDVMETLIKRSSLLVLRDKQSAGLLASAGLPGPFRVGSDLIWLTDRPDFQPPSSRLDSALVVVSHQQGAHRILEFPSVLASLQKRGMELRLQPWQRHTAPAMDMSLAGTLSADLGGVEVLTPLDDLDKMMRRMNSGELVICSNVHSLVAAALVGARAITLGDDPQLVALARHLGQDAIRPDSSPDQVLSAVERAEPADPDRMAEQVTGAENTRYLMEMFLEESGDRPDVPPLALEPPPWTAELGDEPVLPMAAETGSGRISANPKIARALALSILVFTLVGATLFAFTLRAPASPRAAAIDAVYQFFDGYLRDDGRVARHENGHDTTSEGQSYAMLLAVAARDQQKFDLVWNWTKNNLQTPGGSLAWHWGDGAVLDAQPAPDADLDAALALLLAARRFEEPDYRADAVRLAKATLEESTVKRNGRLYLTAGPWANGPPTYVNPSYQAFRAFSQLASDTSDERWDQLTETGLEMITSLANPITGLMPDWGELGNKRSMRPVPKPGSDETSPTYGYDAVRTTVRLYHSCNQAHRKAAASLWPFFQARLEHGSLDSVLELDGRSVANEQHATAAIGAAAAAAAAGDVAESRDLLDTAEKLVGNPDSYGAAWLALGRVILTTDLLGACPDS